MTMKECAKQLRYLNFEVQNMGGGQSCWERELEGDRVIRVSQDGEHEFGFSDESRSPDICVWLEDLTTDEIPWSVEIDQIAGAMESVNDALKWFTDRTSAESRLTAAGFELCADQWTYYDETTGKSVIVVLESALVSIDDEEGWHDVGRHDDADDAASSAIRLRKLMGGSN